MVRSYFLSLSSFFLTKKKFATCLLFRLRVCVLVCVCYTTSVSRRFNTSTEREDREMDREMDRWIDKPFFFLSLSRLRKANENCRWIDRIKEIYF